MNWEIKIPYRSRAEPLADTAHNCRHLPAEDAEVARRITLAAMLAGTRTAGELLDNLGGLNAAQRRTFIDIARTRAGLEPIAAVEAGEQIERLSAANRRAAQPTLQLCHGRGPDGLRCNAVPTRLGVPVETRVARWHCSEHLAQARPGDMDPPPPPWRYSESGAIVENATAEQARDEVKAESRAREREAAAADRAAEAEAAEEHRSARAAQFESELPPHLRRMPA